jgi:hypothetical protein
MPYFKNDDINLLFIHIPKTGGTSVEKYFSKKYNIPLNKKSLYVIDPDKFKKTHNLNINSSLQHIIYEKIIKYKKYFKIDTNEMKILSIVRNPYDRIISDLFHYKYIDLKSSKKEVFEAIKNHIINNKDNHAIPQFLFVTDENRKLIDNIQILRTESLNDDMYKLGYTDFNNHDNKRADKKDSKINYKKFLNKLSIRLINNYYHNDFVLFNYKKIIVKFRRL